MQDFTKADEENVYVNNSLQDYMYRKITNCLFNLFKHAYGVTKSLCLNEANH